MNDRFQQAFQEEARELLAELEAALLELDRDAGNTETLGRAFRALHTIKGSGAMFGFDQLAGFAHELETAFDRLRNGQLAVSSDLINLTLAAADQLKAMAECEPRDEARCTSILTELHRLTGDAGTCGGKTDAAAGDSQAFTGELKHWRIYFKPAPEALLNGANPLLLLEELSLLGSLKVQLDVSAVPSLGSRDPERCYLAWNLDLHTRASGNAIRDVFIFVEGDSELRIEAQPECPASPNVPAKPVSNSNGNAASSIRVAAGKIDQLVNLVGELVNVQARLSEISARREDPDVLAISEQVDRITAELRENSMSIRMLPLRATFERFRRLVRDLGLELGKEVELAMDGADTELDKTVIDQLNDPLVHLIRNSMDHGIETAAARRAAGKPPVATIRISARHSGAQVLIQVSDDGRGLDGQAIRTRAVERGLASPSAQLSDADLHAFILAPGFSTASKVTDVSGRGVGMDVVRRNVEALSGSVEISSRPGAGMQVTLRLPLTLAIIDGLLVRVGGTHFVLPLANSLECIQLTREDLQRAHGNYLASVRGETIPYIRLRELFGVSGMPAEREQIMVVEVEDGRFGLVVDKVLGNHQTVIKNLGRLYHDVPMISGATILGDGTVALILDPHRLIENAIHATASENRIKTSKEELHGTYTKRKC